MNSNVFRNLLVLAAGVSVILLLMMNKADTDSLSKRIERYRLRADSLHSVMKTIEANFQQKDSVLLVSLASLNKTLEELDKESANNKQVIKGSFMRHDSTRDAYCEEMAKIPQNVSKIK